MSRMLFCPNCGNMLFFGMKEGSSRFFCTTCPYYTKIKKDVKIVEKQTLVEKPNDPIVTKEDLPKGNETEATCPNCDHGRANLAIMQLRPLDEPSTNFYTCLQCERTWREDY